MERIRQKISSRRCVGSVHGYSQVDYVCVVSGLCARAIVCMLLIGMAMFACLLVCMWARYLRSVFSE